jgi:hypothetical protein
LSDAEVARGSDLLVAGPSVGSVNNTLRTDLAAYATRAALAPDLASPGLEHEFSLVAEAILLVAHGGSRRVTVVGLRNTDEILDASRPLAAARHVRLVRLSTDDGCATDVAVERLVEVS